MAAQGSREVLALRGLHDLMTRVNAVPDLAELLRTACQGVVDVLGFQLAVINCLDAHGYLECVAVAGDPSAVAAMMGRRTPADEILDEMAIADEWGTLRFLPHDRLPPDVTSGWVPDIEPLDVPDAWHPLDTLYAPLRDPSGRLLGVLGVDLPEDGLRPGPLRRQVLEMYAVQAGLAIHHAQERERLSESFRLGTAARTIVATAARELDLGLILEQSVAPLVEGFECERLWVRAIEATRTGAGPRPRHRSPRRHGRPRDARRCSRWRRRWPAAAGPRTARSWSAGSATPPAGCSPTTSVACSPTSSTGSAAAACSAYPSAPGPSASATSC